MAARAIARAVSTALALLALGAGCARVPEGYDFSLCTNRWSPLRTDIALGPSPHFWQWDFGGPFRFCSTDQYFCVHAPFMISVPRDFTERDHHEWSIDGAEFVFDRTKNGFQIYADLPPLSLSIARDLPPMVLEQAVRYDFSLKGKLQRITYEFDEEPNEVQRVCRGSVYIDELIATEPRPPGNAA